MTMKFNGARPRGAFSHTCLLAAAAGALIGLAPKQSRADQFVLFDATFTYTWEDAENSTPSKSHYYVTESNWLNVDRPADWTSPVNYRDGTVHIRVEVLEKPPGDQQVGWALCYVANVGSYGCPYTDYYTAVGVFERDVGMDDFWVNAPIQWEHGIKQVDLVYTIDNSGSGHVHNFLELKDQTTPTKVRITMVQVSEGDTYDPSILEPISGTGGSGSGGTDSGGSDSGSSGGTDQGSGGTNSGGSDSVDGSGGQDRGQSSNSGSSSSGSSGCAWQPLSGSALSGWGAWLSFGVFGWGLSRARRRIKG